MTRGALRLAEMPAAATILAVAYVVNAAVAAGVHASFSTLFAARTPGEPSLFGDDQTPVNLFSRLFNLRFGLDLPRQPDGSYAGYLEFTPLPAPSR